MRAIDPRLAGEKDPADFDLAASPKLLVTTPVATRRRIVGSLKQLHSIVYGRVRNAHRPQDTATEQGIIDEIRALSDAKRNGVAEDVRAARLALAASLVLLAERDTRPDVTESMPHAMTPSLLELPDVA